MGKSSPYSACARPITPVAEAMGAAPDVARIAIAKNIRDKALNPDKDLNDALDDYDQRQKKVKPGKGPSG